MGRFTYRPRAIQWPDGKTFAFTVFDDTDGSTLANTAPIYELLRDLGFRTTKSAWPMRSPAAEWWHGASCDDVDYLEWLLLLQRDGFEIGYHLNSSTTSTRAAIREGLARFTDLFGPISVAANHYENVDAMYWGPARVGGAVRLLYRVMTRFRVPASSGHRPGSETFWGDLCLREIEFLRNFVFADINTLKQCPFMPYHDEMRPFVRAWFASSDATDADRFSCLLSPGNQERLEHEGGACIVYTHFARGFTTDNAVRPDVRDLLLMMSRRNGWFVPVGELLRFLVDQHGGITPLTPSMRRRLEWTWLAQKVHLGHS